MNFFGHAAVACSESADPRFVFGSMLPDLAPMAGLRPPPAADHVVARGVALHHRTDRIFHGAPAFLALCSHALEVLTAQGLSRASARAVGHVGSELLLDGLLSTEDEASTGYTAALDWAVDASLCAHLELDEAAASDLDRLLRRLRRAPVPDGYREPDFVADRLEAILARRQRLALAPGDDVAVRDWLVHAQRVMRRDADGLLATVHDALRSELTADA